MKLLDHTVRPHPDHHRYEPFTAADIDNLPPYERGRVWATIVSMREVAERAASDGGHLSKG